MTAADPIPDADDCRAAVGEALDRLAPLASRWSRRAVLAGMDRGDLMQTAALEMLRVWPRRRPGMHPKQLVVWLLARGRGAMLDVMRDGGLYTRRHLADLAEGRGWRLVSIDAPARNLFGRSLAESDQLADPRAGDPADLAEDPDDLFRAAVRSVLGRVTSAEYAVLSGCYLRGKYLREVGAEMGLSESRASQIRTDVIGRARELAGV